MRCARSARSPSMRCATTRGSRRGATSSTSRRGSDARRRSWSVRSTTGTTSIAGRTCRRWRACRTTSSPTATATAIGRSTGRVPFAFLAFRIGTDTLGVALNAHADPHDGWEVDRGVPMAMLSEGAQRYPAAGAPVDQRHDHEAGPRASRDRPLPGDRRDARRGATILHLHGDAAARRRHADLRRRVRAGRVREHAARDDDGHRHPPVGVHARPAGAASWWSSR